MPAALLPQQRQGSLDHPKHPKIVRIKQSANVSLARLFNRADEGITSIVENNVQLAGVSVGLRNYLPHLFGVGYVKRQGEDSGAEAAPPIGNIG